MTTDAAPRQVGRPRDPRLAEAIVRATLHLLAENGFTAPPRERGRYQGWFMAVFGTSSVLGPVLGGTFAGQDTILGIDGWRWIFYLNIPIGLLAFAVVSRRLTLPRRTSDAKVDYLGAALLTTSVVPVLLVAEKGREWGWAPG